MSEVEQGGGRVKRRTRRHRRNRLIRRWLLGAAVAMVAVSASTLALKILSPSLFQAKQTEPPKFEQMEVSRERLIGLNQVAAQAPVPDRPVYPYSLIPGGVEDAKELKWVAEHDPVVARHYAGFDYDHAKVVRLTLSQTVFMSYRIGNQVYWTRHRLTLHKGEKVLTDGKMTARVRCANRVENVPQQATAPVEPPVVAFDQPIPMPRGTATQAPAVPFQSALLHGPGLGPSGPLSLYDPVGGGSWVPFSPPPLPSGLCGPGKKSGEKNSGCCAGEQGPGKKKGSGCGSSGGEVPEPGTWILLLSGLAAVYWQSRRRLARG